MIEIKEFILDADIVLYEDGKYFELEWDAHINDGLTDVPVRFIVKKGKRIYKKNLLD